MDSPIQQFRIAADVKAKIQKMSVESGVSVSDIIRACITRALPYVEDRIRQLPPSSGPVPKD